MIAIRPVLTAVIWNSPQSFGILRCNPQPHGGVVLDVPFSTSVQIELCAVSLKDSFRNIFLLAYCVSWIPNQLAHHLHWH